MCRFAALLLCLAIPAVALASNERGNGGSGIYCATPSESVTLYDHYEGKQRSLEIDPSLADLPTQQVINIVFARLQALNPSRAATYRNLYATFFNEVRFTSDEIILIPDTGVGSVPAGCKLVQLAVQEEPSLPGDSRYTISKRYWDLMSPVGQASLILHELAYREFAAQPPVFLPEKSSDGVVVYKPFQHKNSKYVRYFNAHLTSKSFASMSLHDYLKVLVGSRVLTGDSKNGLPIFVSHFSSTFPGLGSPAYEWNVIEFHSNGELKSAYPVSRVSGLSLDIEGIKFDRAQWGFNIGDTYTAEPLTFGTDGLPSSFSFPVASMTPVFQFGDEEILFDQRIGRDEFVPVFHQPGSIQFSGNHHVIRLRNIRTGGTRPCYSSVSVDTSTRKIISCR